jgi:hypothetical protein
MKKNRIQVASYILGAAILVTVSFLNINASVASLKRPHSSASLQELNLGTQSASACIDDSWTAPWQRTCHVNCLYIIWVADGTSDPDGQPHMIPVYETAQPEGLETICVPWFTQDPCIELACNADCSGLN